MSGQQLLTAESRRTSISQGLPPGDPAQRAKLNNTPLGQVPLQPNLLIAGSQASVKGAPMQRALPDSPISKVIAQHLQSLPPDKLAREANRADYMVHSYGTLARKPDLTFKDVISAAGQAIADGKATPQEASTEVNNLPQNPAALRAAIQQRFTGMIIAASMLSGQHNAAAASISVPGGQP